MVLWKNFRNMLENKVSNIEMMRRMQKKKDIINTVKIIKLEYLRHNVRRKT